MHTVRTKTNCSRTSRWKCVVSYLYNYYLLPLFLFTHYNLCRTVRTPGNNNMIILLIARAKLSFRITYITLYYALDENDKYVPAVWNLNISNEKSKKRKTKKKKQKSYIKNHNIIMWWWRCNGAKAEQTLRQRVICFFFRIARVKNRR